MPESFGRRFTGMRPENMTVTGSAVRSSLGEWDLHPMLDRIQCPVLLVYGCASIFPEEGIQRLREGIRDCTLARIKGASHFPSIEAAEEFGNAVGAFLSSPLL